MLLPLGEVVVTKRKIFRKGYEDPVLMVKKTLLARTVSVMGTLKEGIFISSHLFPGITEESVYTTFLLQDDSRNNNAGIKTNECLLIPLIIESPVFSFVWIIRLIPVLCFGRRIKTGKTIVFKQILRNRRSIPCIIYGLKAVNFLTFFI